MITIEVMLQPCDKATTGLPEDHASAMVNIHATFFLGRLQSHPPVPHGVALITAIPIIERLRICYSRFTLTEHATLQGCGAIK